MVLAVLVEILAVRPPLADKAEGGQHLRLLRLVEGVLKVHLLTETPPSTAAEVVAVQAQAVVLMAGDQFSVLAAAAAAVAGIQDLADRAAASANGRMAAAARAVRASHRAPVAQEAPALNKV